MFTMSIHHIVFLVCMTGVLAVAAGWQELTAKKEPPPPVPAVTNIVVFAHPATSATTVYACVSAYLAYWQQAAYSNMYGCILPSIQQSRSFDRFTALLAKQDSRLGAPTQIHLSRLISDDGLVHTWELIISFPNTRIKPKKICQRFRCYKGRFWLDSGGLIPVDIASL